MSSISTSSSWTLKMPGLDGLATLKLIKEKRPGVEVVILTGHGSMESGIDGIQLGAFDFIMKPIRFEDLHEKIRQAYHRKLVHGEKGEGFFPDSE